MYEINETHDPNLRSWVESANDPNTDFPIQNLPWCYFVRKGADDNQDRLGFRIGDFVLDFFAFNEATDVLKELGYFGFTGQHVSLLRKLASKQLSDQTDRYRSEPHLI